MHAFSVFTWEFDTFFGFVLSYTLETNRLVRARSEHLRSARLADVYKKDKVQKFVANHRGKIGRTSGRIDHPSIRECAQSMRLMRFRSRIDT